MFKNDLDYKSDFNYFKNILKHALKHILLLKDHGFEFLYHTLLSSIRAIIISRQNRLLILKFKIRVYSVVR